MSELELLHEAERLRQLKNGALQQQVAYRNPRDLPIKIRTEYGNTLYLYSVQSSETAQDREAREQAKQRKEAFIIKSRQGLSSYVEVG